MPLLNSENEIVYVNGENSQGILSYYGDDDEFNVADFLFFDKKLFSTREEFGNHILSLIKSKTKKLANYTFAELKSKNVDMDKENPVTSFTFYGFDFKVKIIIPRRSEMKTILRENIILTVEKNNLSICQMVPIEHFYEIEFYVGHVT